MRRRARAASLALTLALTAGCAERSSTSPAPVDVKPVFHLLALNGAPLAFFYGMSVVSCAGDKVYWTVGTGGTATVAADSIIYGEAPRGFTNVTGPLPLGPGCYRVYLTGGASARFSVDKSGHITFSGRADGITP